MFGAKPNQRPIEVPDFHMMSTPVTQALWVQVMGSNPSELDEPEHPVDHVSWDDITKAGGFLERINSSEVRSGVAGSNRSLRFRLPSEAEWEYAARGGPHWLDGYAFSGSNDIDSVAWYAYKFGPVRRLTLRLLGWTAGWRLANRFKRPRQTRTHPVAAKKPNQLGLYDMSGNVWEWCQDVCVNDIDKVPNDGTPWLGPGSDRRLRGGCHHNWDIHCTVWFRYGIVRDAYDGCIGFRLVLAPD
jgi:formylglycine-generating enzyme required for sulfatase activity